MGLSIIMNDNLKKLLKNNLARVGISGRDARDGAQWLRNRSSALMKRKGLLLGTGIVWSRKGRTELIPVEVTRPGSHEVTVEIAYSVVSPGTERARLLGQKNAQIPYPHRPGYSVAGQIIHVGTNTPKLKVGDYVACRGVPHQSIVTVPTSSVMKVPDGVSLQDAAMIELGIISSWGVSRSGLQSGSKVCVVGMGPIGALAQRIARARGAGECYAIATSHRRQAVAEIGEAKAFLTTPAQDEEIEKIEADCVIEASGEKSGLVTAIKAAAPGAKVVLLGSTRADAAALPMDAMMAKDIELVGAHVTTVENGYRREGENFLDLLGQQALQVSDLFSEVVDPRDAGVFYRRFASRGAEGAPIFEWTALHDADRKKDTSFFRLPELPVRGLEYKAAPVLRSVDQPDQDPFIGAKGSMRFGMIGCGEIALANATGIKAAPNTKIVTAFDTDNNLAQDLASTFDASSEANLDALLQRDDVDAVVISVPHHLHEPITCKCLEAGKHVVVEKPMANDMLSALHMAKVAKKTGKCLKVCFPMRYEPHVAEAKKLFVSGVVGSLAGVSLSFFVDKAPSYWMGGYTGRSVSSWRLSKKQAGGGVLIMNLSHHLDLVRFLTGQEIESISANTVYQDGQEIEDAISISGQFESGATFALSAGSSVGGTTHEEIRFWGTDGHIELSPEKKVFPLRASDDLMQARWQTLGEFKTVDARAVFFSRFANEVEESSETSRIGIDGLAVQSIIEAAYQSAAEHKVVHPKRLFEGY